MSNMYPCIRLRFHLSTHPHTRLLRARPSTGSWSTSHDCKSSKSLTSIKDTGFNLGNTALRILVKPNSSQSAVGKAQGPGQTLTWWQ